MKLSIVIPVYNEAATIGEILRRVEAVPYDKEIIVVDDGSTDGTREKLSALPPSPDRLILHHDRNRGKGAALRTAFSHVKGDVVIIQDADLEYEPGEYPALIEPIAGGKADVVFGSRFLSGPHRVLYFWHSVGNRLLTLLSNMMTNVNLTDMETCYKVFRSGVLKGLKLRCNRFGFEVEFTAKAARRKYRIYEVPVSYHGREYDQGKKITWFDGLKAVFLIFWFRLFD